MEQALADLLADVRAGRAEVRADSREVGKGDIFVAVPGASEDGARFVPAAVEAGAAAVVCRPEVTAAVGDAAAAAGHACARPPCPAGLPDATRSG